MRNMARPPRGKRPAAAPRFFVQSEFAPAREFCRQFFGEFVGSYYWYLLSKAAIGNYYLADS